VLEFEKKVLGVRELVFLIMRHLKSNPALHDIWIKGEVRDLSFSKSGNYFFSLAENFGGYRYQINCTMYKEYAEKYAKLLEEGSVVECYGYTGFYPAGGQLAFYVEKIEKRDEKGYYWEEFKRIYEKLEGEGLFSEEFKKPIPEWVKRVGIVTSKDSAAIRDVLKILKKKMPMEIYVYHSLVQGDMAVDNIIRGIDWLEKFGVDLIVVTRGGGAYDELSVFNSEKLARRIFECRIPVISAIGHEKDFLISDYVADKREPTPTAAAVSIGKFREDVELELERCKEAILGRVRQFRELYDKIDAWVKLIKRECEMRFANTEVELERIKEKMLTNARDVLNKLRLDLESAYSVIAQKDYREFLKAGFAVVKKGLFNVKSVKQLKKKDLITLVMSDGSAVAEVKSVKVDKEV